MNKEEIFTIGDKTNNGTISKFEIDSNGIRVFFEEKPKNYHVSLNSIKHIKQPLFRTEDGVDIYKGDIAVPIDPKTFRIFASTSYNTGESIRFGNYKYFSSEKAAEEYVIFNSKVLSIEDILGRSKEDLKKLVKSRL